jgi:two-component system, NtrC family, sensor histidine kinase HydH
LAGIQWGIMGSDRPEGPRKKRGALVWLSIVGATAVVAIVGSIIAVFEVDRDVDARRAEELRRLQFNAERSAAQIGGQLSEPNAPHDLATIRDAPWLRNYWSQTLTRQPGRLYAAVVDLDHKIVAHTNRYQEGLRFEPPPGAAEVPDQAELVELTHDVLTLGRRALDMRVPIRKQGPDGGVVGIYHTGLNAAWLDEKAAAERSNRTRFWALVISGMSTLVLLSSVVVVRVTQHTTKLEHEIEAANTRRVSEMHELVLGIAHEIRNPLNAIRLNLHTVGQVFRDEAALGDEEIATMLDEMEGEVERLETLMREMLGFVRPGGRELAALDVGEEVQRTLTILRTNLEQRRIEVHLDIATPPCVVTMEGPRLRQVLINLLKNAIEALTDGGVIEIGVRNTRDQVEIVIADDGPGIAPEDRDRVFVPFFSTKPSGTGLGLALARKFIDEAGGQIVCADGGLRGGCCFRISLPAAVTAVTQETLA